MGKHIQDYLRIIDIFGIDFNFTIFKKNRFNTIIGGVMTIVSVIFFLILFIYFAQDLFKMKNPTVTSTTYIADEYPYVKVNNSIFPMAWRFENENKQPVDLNGYVYVQWELDHTVKNSTTGIFSPVSKYYFDSIPCSTVSFNDDYLSNELKNWNCLDFSSLGNMTVGGFYGGNNNIINYLKGRVFYCKWNYTTNTYSNCTDYQKLNSLLNAQTKMYFSLYIPTLNVDPANQLDPMSTDVVNIFSTLAPLLMKTDRFFYKTVNIYQDVGWFFQTFKNFTGYDVMRRDQDIQVRTIDDYNNPNLIKTLMTTIVYIDKQITDFQSTFVKLQTVIANVGGVFKIFTMGFAFVLYFLHSKQRIDALVSHLFEFDKNKKDNKIKDKLIQKLETEAEEKIECNSPKSNFNRRLSKNTKSPQKIPKSPERSQKEHNDIKSDLGSFSPPNLKKELNPRNSNLIFEIKECSVISDSNKNTPDLNIIDKLRKTMSFKKLNQRNYSEKEDFVTIWMLIKNSICRNKITEIEKSSILLYKITSKLLRKKSDIIFYFKLIDQFSIFKQIFLDSNQSKALNYISKQLVHFEYDSTKIEIKEVKDIIQYYKEKVRNNLINDADFRILECIDKRIIEEIFNE